MSKDEPAPATTTVEQNLRTAGQRLVNLLWENTQARIALSIVAANIVYAFVSPFLPNMVDQSNGEMLKNAFFLVVGFYFGRTNHARIGDVPKLGLDDR